MDCLTQVFGPTGYFSKAFPGYEPREGQVALARAIDEAMTSGQHVLGEGPCGTGKSVAYCVPAAFHASQHRKRIVIATANIALQEQLVKKDLPTLARILPWQFSFALLKGRNNYLCIDKTIETEARGRLVDDEQELQEQINTICAWIRQTKTGDVSELPFIPAPQVWSRFSVSTDECQGDKCSSCNECFFNAAKNVAKNVNIIVTNYHLLFAHLQVRQQTGMDLILPPFDYLILDEAHEAPEIAREFFGLSISRLTIARLANSAMDMGNEELGRNLLHEADAIFNRVRHYSRTPNYSKRLKQPGFIYTGELARELNALVALGQARATNDLLEPDQQAKAGKVADRAMAAKLTLQEIVEQTDPNKVYWIEVDAKDRAKLCGKPINVADTLAEEMFAKTESVSLVSATLTTGNTFDFIRQEIGAPAGSLQVIAETPFDFKHQALLVIPEDLPAPNEKDFPDAVAKVFKQVLEDCDGRTLGLFTSYKNLNAVHERVKKLPFRILRQGEAPRAELTRVFKEDVRSVLLGTESFWTGIDVSGEALTGLVIDKLPFPSPDDPIIDAISERDPKAFANYLIPLAIIMLRQGVGRLIRSKSDVGVVVILDKRLAEKPYGKKFLRSLPPMLATRKLSNIPRFLEEASLARAS